MPHDRPLSPAVPHRATARARPHLKSRLRELWFQVHWFVGVTAGSVLLSIGLSGSLLAFRDELTDAIDPGVRHVQVRDAVMSTPAAIMAAVARAGRTERVANVTVYSTHGMAAKVTFAPPAGERRGASIYVDPYSGAIQPPLRAAAFFDWIERFHRWLLLPRDTGEVVTGTLSACLLTMALSGLYLRWPRRPRSWRSWLTFDTSLTGRPWLRGLHSVLGTCALAIYLVSTSTGLYWSFESVRTMVGGWVGATPAKPSPARPARGAGGDDVAGTPVDLQTAWTTFEARAGGWEQANLRLPERATQPLQVSWLAADAPHDHARNRMTIGPGGAITQDDRYANKSSGDRFVTLVEPLHTGTYFGVPGRLVMLFGGLSLPVFAVTGWMMYLERRRSRRAVARGREGVERQ